MGLPEILLRIQADVDGTNGIGAGRTHIGRRAFATPEIFWEAAQDPTVGVPFVHIWLVVRGTSAETRLSTGSNLRRTQITVEGHYSMLDGGGGDNPAAVAVGTVMTTETAFSELIEAVCDTLRNDGALHGGSLAIGCSPPQLTVLDARELEDVECHHCEITFTVDEEKLVGLTE